MHHSMSRKNCPDRHFPSVILVCTDGSIIRKGVRCVSLQVTSLDFVIFFPHALHIFIVFPVKTAVQCVNCIVKVRFKLQRTIKCGMESVPECKVVWLWTALHLCNHSDHWKAWSAQDRSHRGSCMKIYTNACWWRNNSHQMRNRSSFTHPNVIPNQYDFLSLVERRRCFEKCP